MGQMLILLRNMVIQCCFHGYFHSFSMVFLLGAFFGIVWDWSQEKDDPTLNFKQFDGFFVMESHGLCRIGFESWA